MATGLLVGGRKPREIELNRHGEALPGTGAFASPRELDAVREPGPRDATAVGVLTHPTARTERDPVAIREVSSASTAAEPRTIPRVDVVPQPRMSNPVPPKRAPACA